MRTESRVVMLTDMKGFTAATSRQTREENARMLRLHDALLSPVIAAFGGQRVKSIGDAYLVLFAAPTEALLCAAAIQDRLADHAQRVVESERIEVRIALALGDVRLDGGDVFGEAVNLAARIEAESESGEVWFSESIYWTLDRSRIPVEEMGWRALPGLREEVRLFRVARAVTEAPGDPPYAGHRPRAWWRACRRPCPTSCCAPGCGAGRRRWVTAALARVSVVALVLLAGGRGGLVVQPGAGRALDAAGALRGGARGARRARRPARRRRRRGALPARAAGAGAGRRRRRRHAAGGVPRLEPGGGGRQPGRRSRRWRSEGRSAECLRRRLAARALGESRSREALGALEAIAVAEPPAPEPLGPIERLKRAVAGDGRCGAGDLAREAADAIAAAHRAPAR